MKKNSHTTVPLFILVLVIAIPQLSETIYVPALPTMSKYFGVSANIMELTLTTYLIGFGVGVFFWGSLSDVYGRKPIFIIGFVIYVLSCVSCYYANSATQLLIFRFIQATGASVGSVLGQAVARDVIKPQDRGKVFSVISMAMAFAPAIGPLIGGFAVEYFTWQTVFMVLIAIGLVTICIIISKLPETRKFTVKDRRKNVLSNYYDCFNKMSKDKKVLGFGFMIGSVNGILFGYFAEAPFYFIKILGLSHQHFGLLSSLICIPLLIGSTLSKMLHKRQYLHTAIIYKGLMLILISSILFFLFVKSQIISSEYTTQAITLSYTFVIICIVGISMIIPNSLSHALDDYSEYTGTAASLFGAYYYCIIAIMTLLMSVLHNGQLVQFPLFIFIQGFVMFIVFKLTFEAEQQPKIYDIRK